MLEALATYDMGTVMRAFRTHPFHGRDISQEVAAGWVGITQTRLSRIENGERIANLNKLMRWARALGIPSDLLWFRMPARSPTSDVQREGSRQYFESEVGPPNTALSTSGALLPVIVDGRQILVPVDAERMRACGLGPLLDESGMMAPTAGNATPAAEWETMSPLTRRSLLGGGIAAAAMPMLDPACRTTTLLAQLRQKPTIENANTLVRQAHHSYQAARYQEVTLALPPLMAAIHALADEGPATHRRQALHLECSASIAAAKLETKAGNGAAALGSAHRAGKAALKAGDSFGQAAAGYQLACALLKLGQHDEAESTAVDCAESITGTDPESLTWRGALTLISSIIAARRNDRAEATRRLDHAESLAERLGGDRNIGWTAFGPTNVRIHRMSAAVALTDPRATLSIAEQIDVGSMASGLRGRQAQYHLDSAWAHHQLNEDMPALIHLLDTERIAPELVLGGTAARSLISELMNRERRVQMPGLRSLAQRAGVLP
ncbi:transcriptional regulator with XRE-family HTH domain [Saccharothrix ecbatanensis]|uniref:Transcriptional regulator with XRE-family HTH domain n=1 Tax=Saccharothrix ecbatanensis TaxID=1105145 RepID=A0A7W9HS11_9PSEU|nr:helix-turn-helix transcriptional regulator [Saccharothrix ecbatanensis]MBB5807364.1 transcriptional regulator with XRE-family HTH domain [Saccharothrix ecbatanensis]